MTGKPYTVQGDVYALGVMLYQLVVADFTRALAPGWERDVPDELLREDIAQCVDGDPARRLSSATELATRLGSLEERRTVRASERERLAKAVRRRRQTRLALTASALLLVAALAMGGALLRERSLRRRALEAEAEARDSAALARERLAQGEKARDAAESLVANAIFGLREKLAPLGKIGVLNDLEHAAENYYARLPPELTSDLTRAHQVRLAFNRALIALARSDDDACMEAAELTVSSARALLASRPGDVDLLGLEGDALSLLAFIRIAQDSPEEASGYREQSLRLAAQWLAKEPASIKALQLDLMARSLAIYQMAREKGATKTDPLRAMAELGACQKTADRLKSAGSECIEIYLYDGLARIAHAAILDRMNQTADAQRAFEEADTFLKEALAKYGEHPILQQGMLDARRQALKMMQSLADRQHDASLGQETLRRMRELAEEREKIVDREPARLEAWKNLADIQFDVGSMLVRLNDGAAALPWYEKSVAAGDRAWSPSFDRPSLRGKRVATRVELSKVLRSVKLEGWEQKVFEQLLPGAFTVFDAPSKQADCGEQAAEIEKVADAWREMTAQLDTPARADATLRSFRTLDAYLQQTADRWPQKVSLSICRVHTADKIAQFLEGRGRAGPAAEFVGLQHRCADELAKRFPNDANVIAETFQMASERGAAKLAELRETPGSQKAEKLQELRQAMELSLQELVQRKSLLPAEKFVLLSGANHEILGRAFLECGQSAEAEALLRTSLAEQTAASALAGSQKDRVQRTWDRSRCEAALSTALFALGREEEARTTQHSSATAQEALARANPDSWRFHQAGATWNALADHLRQTGQEPDRLSAQLHAVQMWRECMRTLPANLAALPDAPNRSELAALIFEMGRTQRSLGQLSEAEASVREALAENQQALVAPNAQSLPRRAAQLVAETSELAAILLAIHRPADAQRQVDQAEESIRRLAESGAGSGADWLPLRVTLQKLRATVAPPAAGPP